MSMPPISPEVTVALEQLASLQLLAAKCFRDLSNSQNAVIAKQISRRAPRLQIYLTKLISENASQSNVGSANPLLPPRPLEQENGNQSTESFSEDTSWAV
jgi:hypothetical protein